MNNAPTIKSRELRIALDIPVNKTRKFWEGLSEGKIFGTKCVNCGKLYFPPVADCGECFSSEVEWIELSNEAEIETFTKVAIKPMSFCKYEPYIVAIGRLKEGVKVLAWLSGFEESQVKVGLKVKLAAKALPERNFTYEFVPLS